LSTKAVSLKSPDEQALIRFLTTGELGPLKFDITVEQLEQLWGPPDEMGELWVDPSGTSTSQNVFYGDLSLTFYNQKLSLFIVGFRRARLRLPTPLRIGWYRRIYGMTIDSFVNFLKNRSFRCQYVVEEDDPQPSVVCLNQSGMDILFDPRRQYRIQQITVSNSGPGNRRFRECQD
jgi:hypothetical protein